MDRDDAPRTLDAELLEKGRGNDTLVADKGVWIEERATYDANDDDAEPPAERLREEAYHGAASHGAKVGHNLGYSNGVGAEFELILQHGRVETGNVFFKVSIIRSRKTW